MVLLTLFYIGLGGWYIFRAPYWRKNWRRPGQVMGYMFLSVGLLFLVASCFQAGRD